MARRLLAVLIAGALAAAPAALTAQTSTSLSIAGGLNAPVGRLGDGTDLGYNLAAGLNFGGVLLPVGLRVEGAYNSFGIKNGGGDIRILNATANAVFNVGHTSDSPYVIGGLGIYNRKTNDDFFGTSSSANAVGVNVGGGLRFPVAGLTTFFEARYHAMLGEQIKGANYKFIPITFGIMF